jgi:hypothetical protein
MANIKISQLPAKGANLASTDLVEISEFNGSGYVSKSITGQEIIDGASGGGVTDVTATAPLSSTGGSTPDIAITQAGAADDGYLSTGDWNAFNSKQDALSSGVNIKTINGSSVLGSGNLTISGGNRLATHILSKPRSLFYYSNTLTQGNLQVSTQSPNALIPTLFTPAYDLTINTLILQVTILHVGGLAKVAIYSDLDGVPHTKLFESVDVSTDTTGNKTITGFSFTFTAGTTYWIAVATNSSTAQFRCLNSNVLMLAPVIASSNSTQVFTSWFISATYASLPTTLTTPTTSNLNHSSVPYIIFRAV